MYDFSTIDELTTVANENQISIAEVVIRREEELSEKSRSEIEDKMNNNLIVMREAIKEGLSTDITSMSGLIGGDAQLVANKQETITGGIMPQVIARSLAVSEVNASMGKIVAIPTAGSCGILPGALLTVAEDKNISDDRLIKSLFVASGVGIVIAEQASVSGAAGGCQAECGSASSMTAAAITYLLKGDNKQIDSAIAISLKNVLGLVCDPVAGLVEVPCVKRNAAGASNALVAAEMALAGVESVIPADEVIVAMEKVGKALPEELRETSLGGVATTPTGKKIKNEFSENK